MDCVSFSEGSQGADCAHDMNEFCGESLTALSNRQTGQYLNTHLGVVQERITLCIEGFQLLHESRLVLRNPIGILHKAAGHGQASQMLYEPLHAANGTIHRHCCQ